MHLEKLIDVKFVELKKMSGLLILDHIIIQINGEVIGTSCFGYGCIQPACLLQARPYYVL